jgi:hypothetical protein
MVYINTRKIPGIPVERILWRGRRLKRESLLAVLFVSKPARNMSIVSKDIGSRT